MELYYWLSPVSELDKNGLPIGQYYYYNVVTALGTVRDHQQRNRDWKALSDNANRTVVKWVDVEQLPRQEVPFCGKRITRTVRNLRETEMMYTVFNGLPCVVTVVLGEITVNRETITVFCADDINNGVIDWLIWNNFADAYTPLPEHPVSPVAQGG